MEAHLHRVEVEHAVAGDHDLAVQSRVGRQKVTQGARLREIAEQRPTVPAPECALAAVVLEDAPEAVPLRLELPAVRVGKLFYELSLHRWEGHVWSRHRAKPYCRGRGGRGAVERATSAG